MTSVPGLKAVSFLLLLVLGWGCVPPPEDNDRPISFRRDTAMGQIQKKGALTVGLQTESPPVADTAATPPQGFAVEIARDVASSLGVEVQFVDAPLPELLDGIAGKNELSLDIAFPLFPLTEAGVSVYAFSDPYHVGHQRLMAPRAVDPGPDDLICVADDPWATADRGFLETLGELTEPRPPERCLAMMAAGRAQATTASDLVLARLMGDLDSYEIFGEQMTTEGYGVAVRDDLPGLAEYVNVVLAEAEAEGRWARWYETWLEDRLGPAEPPRLTAEDAAALYPVELHTPAAIPSSTTSP